MKKFSLLISILFLLFLASFAFATTYYASPTGSANCASGCLTGSPCSLATVLTCNVVGGDNVILKDGIYNSSLTIPWSGTAGHSITIKAENDGLAIIDGQSTRHPCYIYAKNDITIEGIVFRNAYEDVVKIFSSTRIIMKRVSAYTAGTAGGDNNHVFNIYYGSYITLEDCVASGYGRVMFDIYESNYAIVRRCYGRWTNYTGPNGTGWIVQLYGTSNAIVENCVGTTSQANGDVGGIAIWANVYNLHADNNQMLGNTVYGFHTRVAYLTASAVYNITNNVWTNNVAVDNIIGFQQRGDDNLQINNLTSASVTGNYQYMFSVDTSDTKDTGYGINLTMKNSVLLTGGVGITKESTSYNSFFIHTYNDLYNLSANYSGTTQGTGEIFINPVYNTTTFGKGAYLIVPAALQGQGENGADIGAEVLYRYVDGTLTSTPLWPWPMEDRICDETGISVTYETGYSGCQFGGGIWKTLYEVYVRDITSPAIPMGLTIN